jgi:hypothetical protein
MYRPTHLDTRAQYITGLHELVDYLAAEPAIPVPRHGHLLTVSVSSTEKGGCAQVRHAARLLGVPVTDETAHGGHYYAQKPFGPITTASCPSQTAAWPATTPCSPTTAPSSQTTTPPAQSPNGYASTERKTHAYHDP